MNMFEDFDERNNQKEEDDEETETSSYSYPSYSRFTYTGKTKSRLGRSRFMRQSNTKDETKKADEDSSGTLETKPNTHFLQTNLQASKTPGVSWLQRDSSVAKNSFTPVGNSTKLHGSQSDLSLFPSQSNFLFNLRNDSTQNASCKRNLPFTTTPFKSKAVPVENRVNSKPLKELNQIYKPENPFSTLNFFSRSKEEKEDNKENSVKAKANVKNNEFEPSWDQLKKICDAAISYPGSVTSTSETVKAFGAGDPSDFRKSNDTLKSSSLVLFSTIDNKEENKYDDSSNIPLDLSSAESTANKNIFSKSLMSGSDNLDGDSSSSSHHQLKDPVKESVVKTDDTSVESTQKTNTDALSGFLPKFLAPKNKSNKIETPEEDVSSHSVGTVVERINFQFQTPFQKSHMSFEGPPKAQRSSYENGVSGVPGNEVHFPFQNKSEVNKDMKKSPPIHASCTRNISVMPVTCNEIQSSSQSQTCINQKYSPPNREAVISKETPKLSPPSANSVPDFVNLVNIGQQILNQNSDQKSHAQQAVANNNQSSKDNREINTLAKNVDAKLGIASKLPLNDQGIVSKPEFNPANQIKPNVQSVDLSNPELNNQQKVSSNILRVSELPNTVYSGIRHDSKPTMIEQRDPMMQPSPQENIQPSVNQKTFLAPQQPAARNSTSDFPHVKPEIPQMSSNRQCFPTMKKQSQFKMPVLRGMPSRADTELVVNGKTYGILSMLGKGGSSEVYQVLDPTSSKLLAVKCVDLSMVDKTIADGYLNEIDLLSRLQGCASVIRMFDYEYVQECKMLYVVMEKGDTDLSHLIRDISKTKKISMSMIIYYWTEMLQAVKDIHDQGIIHSDLKPANFLLVSGRLKLIDFGIASSQGDMTSVVKEVTTGTWNYMSPEAIKNTSASGKGFKITYKSDVWSLGCILYNLVYGKTPFSHITNTWGKLTAIADPNHCIEFPDVGAPAVLLKALRSCFHREPKLRPTVAELLSLPYHSTGDDLTGVGRQVQTILPAQWWLKVAHLFPGVKSNQEGKTPDNAG